MTPALTVEEVLFGYLEEPVLSDLSFTANTGETLAIMGLSGCGKSTLLKLIHGLLTPQRGAIKKTGQSALLFQDDRLLPWLTVAENITLPLESLNFKTNDINHKLKQVMHRLEIRDWQHAYPGQLSGGMKQKAALARALIVEPNLLLLDEPFSAVDDLTRQTLIEQFSQLNRPIDQTTLLVTHDIDEALFLADRITILSPEHGKEIQNITLPELPDDWDSFYQSDAIASLKIDIRHQLQGTGS